MLTLNWLPLNANDEQIATFDACHGDMLMGWGGSMNQLEQSLDDSGAKA